MATATHRFHRFSLISPCSSFLGKCGGTKARGTAVRKIFSTVFSAPFKGKSIYRILMDDKDDSGGLLPEKDSIYRFLSMPMIDCNEITSKLASVIQDEIRLPGSEWHFVLDDSAYKRNRSKNAELATKCFDHTGHTYFSGYRMLTFGIIDGTTFMPISQINMS